MIYVFYEILVRLDEIYDVSSLRRLDVSYGDLSMKVNIAHAGGLFTALFFLVVKALMDSSLKGEYLKVYISTTLCVSFSFVSSILTLVWGWGGIFIDMFG